jgi:hypothetical protein
MKYIILIALSFVLLFVPQIVFGASLIPDDYVNEPSIMDWSIIFVSSSPDNKCFVNQNMALNFYASLSKQYLDKFGIDNEMFAKHCVSDDVMSEAVNRLTKQGDLTIVIPDYFMSVTDRHTTGSLGHYSNWNVHTIVSQSETINIEDKGTGWTLSHELAHFVLEWKDYDRNIRGEAIHEIQKKYNECGYDDTTFTHCTILWDTIETPLGKWINVMSPSYVIKTAESMKKINQPVSVPKHYDENITLLGAVSTINGQRDFSHAYESDLLCIEYSLTDYNKKEFYNKNYKSSVSVPYKTIEVSRQVLDDRNNILSNYVTAYYKLDSNGKVSVCEKLDLVGYDKSSINKIRYKASFSGYDGFTQTNAPTYTTSFTADPNVAYAKEQEQQYQKDLAQYQKDLEQYEQEQQELEQKRALDKARKELEEQKRQRQLESAKINSMYGNYLTDISIDSNNKKYTVTAKLAKYSHAYDIRITANNECPFEKQVYQKDHKSNTFTNISFAFEQSSNGKPSQCAINFTVHDFKNNLLDSVKIQYNPHSIKSKITQIEEDQKIGSESQLTPNDSEEKTIDVRVWNKLNYVYYHFLENVEEHDVYPLSLKLDKLIDKGYVKYPSSELDEMRELYERLNQIENFDIPELYEQGQDDYERHKFELALINLEKAEELIKEHKIKKNELSLMLQDAGTVTETKTISSTTKLTAVEMWKKHDFIKNKINILEKNSQNIEKILSALSHSSSKSKQIIDNSWSLLKSTESKIKALESQRLVRMNYSIENNELGNAKAYYTKATQEISTIDQNFIKIDEHIREVKQLIEKEKIQTCFLFWCW